MYHILLTVGELLQKHFNAGSIITEGETIDSAGGRLLDLIRQVASGRLTKAETMGTQEPVELYMRNTVF